MISVTEIGKIKAPLFILGLGTLLVNDFYLKYAWANVFTGKLSDLAGLFIFPFFFSAIRPQSKKVIYIATAAAFVIWKAPISQPLIDFGNRFGVGIFRTVDYSDLWALLILPLSYRYYRDGSNQYNSENHRNPITISLAAVSLFSFCATTLPRQEVEIQADTDKTFILNLSKEAVFSRLSPAYSNTDTLQRNDNDSLYYLYFYIPNLKADVTAVAKIYKLGPNKTAIKLDSVTNAYVTGGLFTGVDQDDLNRVKKLRLAELEEYFKNFFVKELENNSNEKQLYYKNIDANDGYSNKN